MINLFQDSEQSTQVKPSMLQRKESKRPAKLDLSSLLPQRQKWAECKIYGKNILIRSYAGGCCIGDDFYVYGGAQLLNGILGDFHKMNVNPKDNTLVWNMIEVKKGKSPGPRAKHALIGFNKKIYLVGGIKSSVQITNDIYVYDITTFGWQKLNPKGFQLPPLENFGCVLIKNNKPQIITICGYDGKLCESTNAIYSYHIQSNQVHELFKHSQNKKIPSKRLGCGVAFDDKNKIYIFGGKAYQERLNDLWQFDLTTNKYSQIFQDQTFKPLIRNGHSLTYYNDRLFLFGGIHDITWELDDLFIYDIIRKQWMMLETNSARKKKQTTTNQQSQFIKKQKPLSLQNKRKSMTYSGISPVYNHGILTQRKAEQLQATSPTKMTNELKYKAFLHKKAQLLKTFQVKQQQRQKLIKIQPSSQAMKNSLDMIGNGLIPPDSPTRRKSQFLRKTYSRFMQPLVITTCFIPGKKPCARDGHNAILMDKNILFFGGDRHHMSFNDMYMLNLDSVISQLPKYN